MYLLALKHLAACERRPQKHCGKLLKTMLECCRACCNGCCKACGKTCCKARCIARFIPCCTPRRAEWLAGADFADADHGWTPTVCEHGRCSLRRAHANHSGCTPP